MFGGLCITRTIQDMKTSRVNAAQVALYLLLFFPLDVGDTFGLCEVPSMHCYTSFCNYS